MDIRKLQRVIVDGLEDVKAQHILVFNTEHLSSLFERVIIASGSSNRQTKSLASSVREAVKEAGFPVPRTEGESNGEWIIVDCGAAVVHVMQPTIRDFYRLEEIWGDKPVRMKIESGVPKLVKAAAQDDDDAAPLQPLRRTSARRASPVKTGAPPPSADTWTRGPGATPAAKRAPAAKKVAVKAPARKAVVMPGAVAKKAASKKAAPQRLVTRVVGLKKPTAKKAAPATRAPAKKAAGRTFGATTAPRRAPAKKAIPGA